MMPLPEEKEEISAFDKIRRRSSIWGRRTSKTDFKYA